MMDYAHQDGPLVDLFSIPILQHLVYGNLEYNTDTFNWASGAGLVDQKAGTSIDEKSPDISRSEGHGGKLLTIQGWADPLNAATWPIEHLKQLESCNREVNGAR